MFIEMDEKWWKIELPKTKKYCTRVHNFNEYFTKVILKFVMLHCKQASSVLGEFQMAGIPLY
ncbi:hypothetical protein T4E_3848 [Trichinella pseudospiralis]|uniref:Uncharacterized protein n=1 Tax=Trichinella pseudospiralis TaxID=6337 RepID=A0A0V0YF47_TRIPS|nr:hypothetical protein T4E_3848 [Trichinella pseudospiralis]